MVLGVQRSTLASQILVALEEVITGGVSGDARPPVGIYRSANAIVRLFNRTGFHDATGAWSRVSHVTEKLDEIYRSPGGANNILRLVEEAVNPRDYLRTEDRLQPAVDHLNLYLKLDGIELRSDGKCHRLYDLSGTSGAVDEAQRVVDLMDFEGCKREFDRALANLDNDPAASITAACSALESIAKTILVRMGEPIPSHQDVSKLVYATMSVFKLVPEEQDDQDLKRMLGSLGSVVGSIGAFRTKAGSAHGRGDGHTAPDRQMAELCVNSASAVALFLLHHFAAATSNARA